MSRVGTRQSPRFCAAAVVMAARCGTTRGGANPTTRDGSAARACCARRGDSTGDARGVVLRARAGCCVYEGTCDLVWYARVQLVRDGTGTRRLARRELPAAVDDGRCIRDALRGIVGAYALFPCCRVRVHTASLIHFGAIRVHADVPLSSITHTIISLTSSPRERPSWVELQLSSAGDLGCSPESHGVDLPFLS